MGAFVYGDWDNDSGPLCQEPGRMSFSVPGHRTVALLRFYVTMSPKEVNRNGESPLMQLLERLGGMKLSEFARETGCNYDNLRALVKGRRKTPSFTVTQWKRISELLEKHDVPLAEFPESFEEKA